MIASLLAVAGCHEAVEPSATATLSVTALTIRATQSVGIDSLLPVEVRFDIPVTWRNTGELPLKTAGEKDCVAFAVERAVGAAWEEAYSSGECLSPPTGEPTPFVEPGDSQSLTLSVAAALQPNVQPAWRAPVIEGTYRVTIPLLSPSSARILATSNTFELHQD